jgi:hypothetical protein
MARTPLHQRLHLEDFWLDRYEVTNKQFKEFVDRGGYQKREWWKHPFAKEGKVLSWDQAMAEFCDATGRLGPSTWQWGTYPEGQGDFPVGGVNWYEAAAYAEFAGKSLPTFHQWHRAAGNLSYSDILRLSNFNGKGPAPVGTHQGLSPYGAYDTAGNVREWCWNQAEFVAGGRYILGGAWTQAPYMFAHGAAAPAFDRSAINGFRCARNTVPPADGLLASLGKPARDYSREKPVSDEIFRVYRGFFSYDRTDLNAALESVDDKQRYWRRETVTFDAAYPYERVIAHLLLPKNAVAPYQTVAYVPGSGAEVARSSDDLGLAGLFGLSRGSKVRHTHTHEMQHNPEPYRS